ncbi:hypothetical protein C8J56DRAFT_896722 [Mycena floridula]|nr:hypothetical protein C8J56DRAFT_896722 [Mycena floridula]
MLSKTTGAITDGLWAGFEGFLQGQLPGYIQESKAGLGRQRRFLRKAAVQWSKRLLPEMTVQQERVKDFQQDIGRRLFVMATVAANEEEAELESRALLLPSSSPLTRLSNLSSSFSPSHVTERFLPSSSPPSTPMTRFFDLPSSSPPSSLRPSSPFSDLPSSSPPVSPMTRFSDRPFPDFISKALPQLNICRTPPHYTENAESMAL